jgi:hypothetical protein
MKFKLFFFTLLPFLAKGYEANYMLNTTFTNKSDIIKYLEQKNFYLKYLKIIGAKEIKFNPEISDNVAFPLEITYYSYPKNIVNFFIPKVHIKQIWNRNNNKFTGFILTKYLQLEINLEPIKVNKNFILYLQSNIIKKNILVPKSSAITILKDICFILSNVDKKFNI